VTWRVDGMYNSKAEVERDLKRGVILTLGVVGSDSNRVFYSEVDDEGQPLEGDDRFRWKSSINHSSVGFCLGRLTSFVFKFLNTAQCITVASSNKPSASKSPTQLPTSELTTSPSLL